ncbi:MAG: MAPEG family protein [Hyphomonadaceae bacterium]|jgi:uncharacterized MAPEG superfamily protein|nr:MAPEG family protein [Hyphomonadaceae bacterium]
MSMEIYAVLGGSILMVVLVIIQGVIANRQFDPKDLIGARDGLVLDQGLLGRAKRATANTMEALWMFVPAALVIELTGQGNALTAIACGIFLIARVIYIPAYLVDPPMVRSGAWFAGFLATGVLVVQAFWPG